ncbi:protein indeterminate-domain 1 [Phtheirospermum japonicum]|uniref:Protein indeterminate-domain 1 n=1 Tax=Phtheirospermum japonicum TaxID=374723 RepID=A0A830DDU0_9LAMI|nr:protein indeterminate-domain 1 [Phtheirospermum japonicum]
MASNQIGCRIGILGDGWGECANPNFLETIVDPSAADSLTRPSSSRRSHLNGGSSYTMNEPTASGDSSSGNQTAPPKPTAKKKRNLPGMPDPGAEVIALSPKTLLATNRFVCEICNKGFQRDQNLQLHRRGHNLPWKLMQRSSKEIKKKVYVCPESSCVHHDPSRALGDLTGIKKHFCRKHGEKKWKCDKCSKKYAVQSDCKAHSKVCGTREYKCDCGTSFTRRDSFVTHRAFCDALAEERAKPQPSTKPPGVDDGPKIEAVISSSSPPVASPPPPPPPPMPPSLPPSPAPAVHPMDVTPSYLPDNNSETEFPKSPTPSPYPTPILDESPAVTNLTSSSNGSSSSNTFASLFASSTSSGNLQSQTTLFYDLFQSNTRPDHTSDSVPPSSSSDPISLCLAVNHGPSIFVTSPQPALSATALLQKAAQMGPTTSNASLFRFSSSPNERQQIESDGGASLAAGLGLGLGMSCDAGSGLKELMLGTPSVFGPKHITLDLLGLGMAANGGSSSGLSALVMPSINAGPPFGGHDMRSSS